MSTAYKPKGHPTVSAYLVVDGASRTIDFLVRALDGVEINRVPAGGTTWWIATAGAS